MAKKTKKINRARSSPSLRVRTLPRLAILGSILRREGSQKIKLPQSGFTKPLVAPSLLRSKKGLPITIGVEKSAFRQPTKNQSKFQDTLERTIKQTSELLHRHKICKRRKTRRQLLFQHGYAGKGKTRSPGRNNTYRKNHNSTIKC